MTDPAVVLQGYMDRVGPSHEVHYEFNIDYLTEEFAIKLPSGEQNILRVESSYWPWLVEHPRLMWLLAKRLAEYQGGSTAWEIGGP